MTTSGKNINPSPFKLKQTFQLATVHTQSHTSVSPMTIFPRNHPHSPLALPHFPISALFLQERAVIPLLSLSLSLSPLRIHELIHITRRGRIIRVSRKVRQLRRFDYNVAAACAAAAASSSSSSPRPSVRSPVGGSQSGAGTLRRAAAGFNDFWGEPFSARPHERESETEGSKDIEASFGPEEAEERK